jgi:hypothetical protein
MLIKLEVASVVKIHNLLNPSKATIESAYSSRVEFKGLIVHEGDFHWFIPNGHYVGLFNGEVIAIEPDALPLTAKSLSNL